MTVAVYMVDTRLRALVSEPMQLLYEAAIGGNQAAPAGKRLRFSEKPALSSSADGNLALPAAFAPARPKYQSVTAICPRRLDLDRLGAARSERSLKLER